MGAEEPRGTPVNPDAVPTLAFLEAGKVSGNASCNRFTGPVELGDRTIHVGTLATTGWPAPTSRPRNRPTSPRSRTPGGW